MAFIFSRKTTFSVSKSRHFIGAATWAMHVMENEGKIFFQMLTCSHLFPTGNVSENYFHLNNGYQECCPKNFLGAYIPLLSQR